jgi:hypothetical protein
MSLKEDICVEIKINTILKQTNYSREEAEMHLLEKNMDEMSVIKSYLGIPEKKKNASIGSKSVQQEIYKQIRHKLNETKIDVTQMLQSQGKGQAQGQGKSQS